MPTKSFHAIHGMRRHREGVLVVMLAIILPILIVILGFSIDFANVQRVRSEIRVTADLAAKAATNQLASTGDVDAAREAARLVAEANLVCGEPLTLADDQIIFGHSVRNGDGSYTFHEGLTPFNATRIIASRTEGSGEGTVGLFFGRFYGRETIGLEQTAVASYQDIDIVLVLDRSGSMKDPAVGSITPDDRAARQCQIPMADSRWSALDGATELFLSVLDQSLIRERVGVVTFASDNEACAGYPCVGAEVDQPLSFNLNSTRVAMQNRSLSVWNGATNIYAGLQEAKNHFANAQRDGADKVIILITDGSYNVGGPPFNVANACFSDGITVHTITFGDDANKPDMQQIANDCGGSFYHANDGTDLERIFQTIAGSFAILVE